MSPFSGPIFLGQLKSEGCRLQKRAAALWEGTRWCKGEPGKQRREAAGRRNWPEAVPRKMSGRKSLAY